MFGFTFSFENAVEGLGCFECFLDFFKMLSSSSSELLASWIVSHDEFVPLLYLFLTTLRFFFVLDDFERLLRTFLAESDFDRGDVRSFWDDKWGTSCVGGENGLAELSILFSSLFSFALWLIFCSKYHSKRFWSCFTSSNLLSFVFCWISDFVFGLFLISSRLPTSVFSSI